MFPEFNLIFNVDNKYLICGSQEEERKERKLNTWPFAVEAIPDYLPVETDTFQEVTEVVHRVFPCCPEVFRLPGV